MVAPINSVSTTGLNLPTGLEPIRQLNGQNTGVSKLRLAQATGDSAVLSKAQVLELNPRWPGTAAASFQSSSNQIESIGRQLADAQIVSKPKTPDDSAVLLKPLRLADGIVLPIGTVVSGSASPGAEGYPVNQSGSGTMALNFQLPNGSSIEFKAAMEKKSGLGATNVEIFDKTTGKTTTAQFRAALFLDPKSGSLGFINGPANEKYRLSDLRTQANALTNGPGGKTALGAALKQVGLGQL